MKMKLVLIFVFLMILPIASANTEYNQTGSTNQDYLLGTGIFNLGLTTSSSSIRTLVSGSNIPLVADLNNDGINEIIIMDSSDVRLFKNNNLEIVDSITLEAGTYSNMIVVNIDNDTYNEIILVNEASGNGNVSILQYNGSDFIREYLLDFDIPTIADGTTEIMINCNDGQGNTESISCIYVMASNPLSAGTKIYAMAAFNSTDTSELLEIVSTVDTNENYCLPQIPSIVYENFDLADSRKEFIFTITEFKRLANERLNIMYVDVAENLTITTDQRITFTSGFNPVITALNCNDNIGKFYTSPMVKDIDGSTSNGKETIIAINEDSEDFVIKVFKSSGSVLDTHPSLFQADGELLSNVMLSNVFGDTGTVEYCVLGHDDEDQQINLLCGSQLTGNIFDTIEFKFNVDGRFNVTNTFNEQNMISHMAQHSSALENIAGQGLVDTTELISTYGVFQLRDESFNSSLFIKNMDIIFENPAGDSACIQVDVEKTGAEDIICLKETSVFYIDDSLTNNPAEITEITINPCIDSVIKINTTMQIEVTVEDQNPDVLGQDLVSSVVSVYDGTDNQQTSSVLNVTSGTTAPHTFQINQTGTNRQIRITGFDTANPDTIDTILQSFTVGLVGVEFGDCKTTFIITPIAEIVEVTEASLTEDADDNAITNSVNAIIGLTGIGGTTLWLFGLLVLSAMIWFEGASRNLSGNSILGTIAILNVMGILLGARLGMLSTGLVVVITVMGVVIIGVFLGKFLTGASTEA